MILLNKGTNKVVEELGIFPDEADLHILVEHNIQPLFGLELIKRKVHMKGEDGEVIEPDSLCYDLKNDNFVIVEYKKLKDKLVINQVDNYRLSLSEGNNYQENQRDCVDFLFERMETLGDEFFKKYEAKQREGREVLRKKKIKWDNTKIICIAHSFDNTQKRFAKKYHWELWEYRRFSNDTIIFYSPTNGENLIPGKKALSTAASRQQTAPSPPFNTGAGDRKPAFRIDENEGVLSPTAKVVEKVAYTANTLDEALAKMGKPVYQKWEKLAAFFNKRGFRIQKNIDYYSLKNGKELVCSFGFPSRKKRFKVECYRGIEYSDGSRAKQFFTAENIPEEKLKRRRAYKQGKSEGLTYHLFIEENSDESDLNDVISLIKQKDAHMRQK